ncbi:FadR family transcriptional regulator [Rhizobium sp. KVB221]|uniref:FadR family transcriptional regulator n=1 Tax=Rhizobium setariae TaxID=2801340 RepID=A0A937CR71_9HYPH|nr:FadR/GntR family transcriptional regulator [Rhizobium setariae]MBL0375474.1 FadR family transcriptional regulator [Rhizobium setariae]
MLLQNPRAKGSAGISLHAKLLDQLGQAIVRGELAPGDPLPNADDWSAAHGVSRTVLREVIKVLAGKGMVESRPKIGTRIRDRSDWNFLDPDVLAWRYGTTTHAGDARSLFELRRAIEPMAGSLAAERANKAEIAKLEQLYEKMELYVDDNDRFAEADLAFHQAILRMTGNELFGSLAALTETAMLISFRLSDDNPYGQRPSLPLHRRVCDCIARRDPDGTRNALIELLDLAEADVHRSLAARSKPRE